MRRILLFLALITSGVSNAQTTSGLLAFYPFDGDLTDVTGNSANTGIAANPPSYLCGVDETALSFNGVDDQINLVGPLIEEFNVEDFTVSFYFKATGSGGTQYLLSKRRTDCSSDFAFFIRYRPSTQTINAVLTETPNKSISLTQQLNGDRCWQHIVVVRDDTRIKLYVNGQLAQEERTVGRINIENDGDLLLGSSDCLGTGEAPFEGLIDDLRFYRRSLLNEEVEGLYFRPDMIQTPDTLAFLGSSVDIRLFSPCGAGFSWSPTDGLDDPTAPEPTITPTAPGATVYTVRISDDVSSCIALDSVRINVVDPDDLDCNTVFLPNAFTPNGDNLNDTYGISNPYALQDLVSFEIFDRWGGRVFFTDDPFERWDGSFKGTPINSGVLLYKVVFVCNQEEKVATGSVTIMR